MTSFRDRQRAAARARLEREMAARAEAAYKRRRMRRIITSSVASALALVLVVIIVVKVSGSGDDGASASETNAACVYTPIVDPSSTESATATPTTIQSVGTPPADSVSYTGVQLMTMTTNQGTIRIQVNTSDAPCTAASFTYLAGLNFFDNSICHRLSVADTTSTDTTSNMYILQCGDPSGTGTGGPDYQIADENLPADKYPAYPEGTVAMANSGSNTNGSQFFIVYGDTYLSADYTVFGYVLQGLDIVKTIAAGGTDQSESTTAGAPLLETVITSLTVEPVTTSISLPAVDPSASDASSTDASVAPEAS